MVDWDLETDENGVEHITMVKGLHRASGAAVTCPDLTLPVEERIGHTSHGKGDVPASSDVPYADCDWKFGKEPACVLGAVIDEDLKFEVDRSRAASLAETLRKQMRPATKSKPKANGEPSVPLSSIEL